MVKYTDYSGRTLYPTCEALQSAWPNPDTRSEELCELTERGIRFTELATPGFLAYYPLSAYFTAK